MTIRSHEKLTAAVKERYANAARQAASGEPSSCCGDDCGCQSDPITRDLYQAEELTGLPAEAVAASLGCGNPTALAQLQAGDVVLDLGSGGGIDVLLSAQRVGPSGKAYGLDMTDEMLALARANQEKAGVVNVEFLRGEIEDIPLPDASVDVIISNCVINLSGDKDRVLLEAFRVLRPGGRLAVSDVVIRRPLPEVIQRSMALWTGCVGGALEETSYRSKLAAQGFVDIDIEPTRVYGREDALALIRSVDGLNEDLADEIDGAVMSAFIRARKPSL
ncbi:MAG: arsenite methyltransferase [Gemmatimonadetes bacterium]|nr:arsenite methyltransferase [Gemmatimonadota bacterium]